MSNTANSGTVDVVELEAKVKAMYRAVANEPDGDYHFEIGRGVAERLGYPPALLDQIPAAAVESFAGVGHFFDLTGLSDGETVVDLGSGSGMDVFAAAVQVGERGRVVGVDMTEEQLAKAAQLRDETGLFQAEFRLGRIESLPLEDASVDCVISNGVINLAPDKGPVFREAARVLRPAGRLAVADIVTERQLTDAIVCDSDLWASCIGGAARQDAYQDLIEASGFSITHVKSNPYNFLSDSARGATTTFGVKSLSILATKT